jgi:hypothetical protein
MHTILMAHHDVTFAEGRAELRAGGSCTNLTCPGPWSPQRCLRCDTGYCPLIEAADLMIHDPLLVSPELEGAPHNLAVDSALAHPEVPILLAWSPQAPPDAGTLRAIHQQAPPVHVASHDPATIRRQVRDLLVAHAHPRPGSPAVPA